MGFSIHLDFGSTFTKGAVFCLDDQSVVMTTRVPSTVSTDASIGLRRILECVESRIGRRAVHDAHITSCSSAAGGLRMAVCGLTEDFSLRAGQQAAMSAGARVIRSFDGILSVDEALRIRETDPEILLICGGTDGGNEDRVVANAQVLAEQGPWRSSIIFAGNADAAGAVRSAFGATGSQCIVSGNVSPTLGKLRTTEVNAVIRDLFMNRIVGMKGMSAVRRVIGDVQMPTPAAVLAAGELLSRGPAPDGSECGIGALMMFDIGGATTDVYSFIPSGRLKIGASGAEEPYGKRTVEGDLGMRWSAGSLAEQLEEAALASAAGIGEAEVAEALALRHRHVNYIADDESEMRLDTALARGAVRIAGQRHAGRVVRTYAGSQRDVVRGKDLSRVERVIGTGGILVSGGHAPEILGGGVSEARLTGALLPESPELLLDTQYLLFAVGLLALDDPQSAYRIGEASLQPVAAGAY